MIRPDWRECPKDDVVGQWSALYVTMNPLGEIAMSRFTYERMNAPKAFVLLFDASNNRIGLKPAALTMRNAYPVRVHGPRGGKKVRGFRLMQANATFQRCPHRRRRDAHPRPAHCSGFDKVGGLSTESEGGIASQILFAIFRRGTASPRCIVAKPIMLNFQNQ